MIEHVIDTTEGAVSTRLRVMRQAFANFFDADRASLNRARVALREAGFDVHDAHTGGPGLAVRVRSDTSDTEDAWAIVLRYAPQATRGPQTSPSTHIVNYRERH